MVAAGDFLTVKQVLEVLPVGRSTIYSLVQSGRLRSCRVGATGRRMGRILVARADLDIFIEKSRQVRSVPPTRLDLDEIHARVRNGAARNRNPVD